MLSYTLRQTGEFIDCILVAAAMTADHDPVISRQSIPPFIPAETGFITVCGAIYSPTHLKRWRAQIFRDGMSKNVPAPCANAAFKDSPGIFSPRYGSASPGPLQAHRAPSKTLDHHYRFALSRSNPIAPSCGLMATSVHLQSKRCSVRPHSPQSAQSHASDNMPNYRGWRRDSIFRGQAFEPRSGPP